MVAATAWSLPKDVPAAEGEERMVVRGVSWKDYVILREALDTPGLRMTYCEGVLELMSPSRAHELWKTTAARLLETYAFLLDVPLVGYGSTTFRKEAKQRGAEPDECWRVGSLMKDGEFPDIVLEVIHTSPILDKLYVYDGFEVPEVWLWKENAFQIHRRNVGGGYAQVERSTFFPALDFASVAPFVTREDQHTALKEFARLIQK
jgi:Uma2 family endonuclease